MYYSNGNYEAFARPEKPKAVEGKSAHIIGSGLAGLASACFLVRDGQMDGKKIKIYEQDPLPGGALDGIFNPDRGYIIRGGREIEEKFETLWDLLRSIPSLEDPNISVLDEFYWLNKQDPSDNQARLVEDRGTSIHPTDEKLGLSSAARRDILKLIMMREEDLQDKALSDVLGEDFFGSNFWLYWSTMFPIQPKSAAMEMRRYMMRFIHHIHEVPSPKTIHYTRYNQYESMILPMVRYLESHGVIFQYDTKVLDIKVSIMGDTKLAKSLEMEVAGQKQIVDLTDHDLIFVTNGSITESTTYGTNTEAPTMVHDLGPTWELWESLAAQSDEFGKPKKFYQGIPEENWTVAGTATFYDDRIAKYIIALNKKNPYSGNLVTSGDTAFADSNWKYGYVISRQPHFKTQKPNELVIWLFPLISNQEGNYVKKKATECTGMELCQEWLYHMGVPEEEIDELAASANTIPAYMPYLTSNYQPRALGDRPLVVPKGSKNLAFIGNYAETERDTTFTVEYPVRTAMEAVYSLLDIDRGVPEVFGSQYDIRWILKSFYHLSDRRKLGEMDLPEERRGLVLDLLSKIEGTYLEDLLKESGLL